jgi:hypothetical protein
MNPEEFPDIEVTPLLFLQPFRIKLEDNPDYDYFLIFDRGSMISCRVSRCFGYRGDATFYFWGVRHRVIFASEEQLMHLCEEGTLTGALDYTVLKFGLGFASVSDFASVSEALFVCAYSKGFQCCKVFKVPQMPRCKIISLNSLFKELSSGKHHRDSSPVRTEMNATGNDQ